MQKVWTNCDMSKYYCGIVGGTPPRCNIFWQILHTFCLLFNLFWTFPLKSIGFLRFQLIFRWFFNDFSGFSAYFQDIFDLSIAEIEWIPHTKGWAPYFPGFPQLFLEDTPDILPLPRHVSSDDLTCAQLRALRQACELARLDKNTLTHKYKNACQCPYL